MVRSESLIEACQAGEQSGESVLSSLTLTLTLSSASAQLSRLVPKSIYSIARPYSANNRGGFKQFRLEPTSLGLYS